MAIAIWLIAAGLEAMMLAVASTSALHDQRFELWQRLTFVAADLAALAGFIGLFLPVIWLLRLLHGALAEQGRRLLRGGVLAAAAAGLFVWQSSWGMHFSTGGFLDREGLRFFWLQPIQMLYWSPLLLVIGLPVTTILLTWSVCKAAQALVYRPRGRWWRLESDGLFLIGLCVAGWVSGLAWVASSRILVSDPNLGVQMTLGQLHGRSMRLRGGTFAHAMSDAANSIVGDPALPQMDMRIGISRPHIINFEEYQRRAAARSGKRWNVIFILVESLRADVLRVAGAKLAPMTNLDALAAESHVFVNAYTTASHTNYANPAFLSSQYPLRSYETHIYPADRPYPRVMIYEALKAAGYRTGFISSENENWGGMADYLASQHLDYFMYSSLRSSGQYLAASDTGFARWAGGSKHAGSVDDRVTVDDALRWIGQDATPFFLYLNFQSTHFPYMVPDDFPRRFGRADRKLLMSFGYIPADRVEDVKKMYADSAAYVDYQLERLIQGLKRNGQWDRTILVISGDHGEGWGEHGFFAHASLLYNEVMKVPLLLRAPGLAAAVDARLAQHVDMPPTVLGLLGLPAHPGFQGINLLGGQERENIYLVAQSPLVHQYALVRDGRKLIVDINGGHDILYDLRVDPGEKQDVAGRYPEVVKQMRLRLDTWRAAQLGYYSNTALMKKTYPPVLEEATTP